MAATMTEERRVVSSSAASTATLPSSPPPTSESTPCASASALVSATASASAALEDRLSKEVLRKLRLASETSVRLDRETICEEAFSDITGELDSIARGVLGAKERTCFYEILADYCCRTPTVADAFLAACRGMWGQPFVAAIYTLLLHRWLLERRDAGGLEQRQKHLNVLVAGARQLFWIDVHANTGRFQPLYLYLADHLLQKSDSRLLDSLPLQARTAIVTLCACFLPFYTKAEDMVEGVDRFPSRYMTSDVGIKRCRDVDFLFSQFTDTMRAIKAEPGLQRYLKSMAGLKECEQLVCIRTVTRLRLEAELYSLTSPSGPRNASRAVRDAALEALDSLFPAGKISRHVVALVFQLLRPFEWPSSLLSSIPRWSAAAKDQIVAIVAWVLGFLYIIWLWVCQKAQRAIRRW